MTNSPRPPAAPPFRLGKYFPIVELAQGGMGLVYLAVAQGPAGFSKLTVIKELKPSLLEEQGFLEMFLDEARLAARLNHPNVVQTNEVNVEDGRAYLAMEYLDGQPLNRVRSRLGRARTLPLATDLRIIAEACNGLHYAHQLRDFDGSPLRVVHRDVSPHNVFVTYDGQVKIVDFGVAKAMSSNHETTAGVMKGKVAYMSPEQLLGTELDHRADVFALGVIMWEAISGIRMWEGQRPETIIARVMAGEIPQLAQANPHADPRLVAIVDRATAFYPDARQPSAEALRLELEAYLSTAQGGELSALREIGIEMSVAFAAERAHVSAAVSEQLQLLRSAGGGTQVAPVRLGFNMTGSNAAMSARAAAQVLGTGEHAALTAALGRGGVYSGLTPSAVMRSASGSGSGSGSGRLPPDRPSGGAGASYGTGSMPVATSQPPLVGTPPPPSQTAGVAIALAVVVLLAMGGLAAGFFVMRARASTTTSTVGPDAATTSSVSAGGSAAGGAAGASGSAGVDSSSGGAAGAADGATVELTVRVSPPGAHVFVDGVPVAAKSGPTSTVKRDAATHKVRAEAAGYVSKTELVTFDKSTEVILQLDRVGAGGGGGGGGHATGPGPSKPVKPDPATPEPTGKPGRPQRPIDTDLDPK